MDRILVAAAAIFREKRVLLVQRCATRAFPFTWECPGGKVEPGENLQLALQREIAEEIGIQIVVGPQINSVDLNPPFVETPFSVFLFSCVPLLNQVPKLMEDQIGLGWFSEEEVQRLSLPPGNAVLKHASWSYLYITHPPLSSVRSTDPSKE